MPKTKLRVFFKPASIAAVLTITLANSAASGIGNGQMPENLFQANFVENVGGGERVNFSGKLRMLSQRIPAAACNLNAGIATEQSAALLEGAVAEFHTILAALEFGDESLGVIGAEDSRRLQRVIEEVHKYLEPVTAAAKDVQSGNNSEIAVQALADQNMELLNIAKLLVTEISGKYSNPVALMQSDAMAIDIAGRQRMLTQKISKELCFAQSGFNATPSLEALSGTVNTFVVSLDALRNGMEQVGVKPAPNAEIEAGLDTVKADWEQISAYVETVAQGGTVDDATRAEIFLGLNKTMADMNKVVGMYTVASQQGL